MPITGRGIPWPVSSSRGLGIPDLLEEGIEGGGVDGNVDTLSFKTFVQKRCFYFVNN